MKILRRTLLLASVPLTFAGCFTLERQHSHNSIRLRSSYGKGAEIWPPGSDKPIDIRDSFPSGVIPIPDRDQNLLLGDDPVRWKKIKSTGRTVTDKLLRRAARLQEDQPNTARLSTTTLLVAGATVRYLQPLDFLLVIASTGYVFVLQKLAAQQRSVDNVTPVLPALPPQGHVPVCVRHPLGYGFSRSRGYFRWLKLGELVGIWGPLVLLVSIKLGYSVVAAPAMAQLIAPPLFFSSCQAGTEHMVTRRATTPLPIRILVPVLYNWIRLGYIWTWARSDMALGAFSRWLALANLAYSTINLWGFLVPIASIRYLRAHFFSVEAAQVVTRAGMDDSVGFLS